MNTITINIDIEKITSDLMEKEIYQEGDTYSRSIQSQVKGEIKSYIQTSVVNEIKKSLNLDEFRESEYTKDYLTKTAHTILNETLEKLVKAKVEDFIKGNARFIIEHQIKNFIDGKIVPRLQDLVSKLIIVNSENVEEEMDNLKAECETTIKQIEDSIK